MSNQTALAIASFISPALSVGIAIWFPFKQRALDREFARERARRDAEWKSKIRARTR
jgi:hypothetical protein